MAETSLVTEDIRQQIGQRIGSELVRKVEKDAVRRFVEAVEDPDPPWQDQEYAKKSKYDEMIVPFFFIYTMKPPRYMEEIQHIGSSLEHSLVLGCNAEFFDVIKIDDVITVEARLAEARELEAKRGKMLLLIVEITFTNQRGIVVAKQRTRVGRY